MKFTFTFFAVGFFFCTTSTRAEYAQTPSTIEVRAAMALYVVNPKVPKAGAANAYLKKIMDLKTPEAAAMKDTIGRIAFIARVESPNWAYGYYRTQNQTNQMNEITDALMAVWLADYAPTFVSVQEGVEMSADEKARRLKSLAASEVAMTFLLRAGFVGKLDTPVTMSDFLSRFNWVMNTFGPETKKRVMEVEIKHMQAAANYDKKLLTLTHERTSKDRSRPVAEIDTELAAHKATPRPIAPETSELDSEILAAYNLMDRLLRGETTPETFVSTRTSR